MAWQCLAQDRNSVRGSCMHNTGRAPLFLSEDIPGKRETSRSLHQGPCGDGQNYRRAHTLASPYPTWSTGPIRHHPHPLLPGLSVGSDKSDRFPPGLKFTLQGSQRQVGGPPHAPLHNLSCEDTQRVRDSAPSPPRGSTQAWGGWLPHRPKGNDSKGPEKAAKRRGRKHSCFPFANSAAWMSLPPLR